MIARRWCLTAAVLAVAATIPAAGLTVAKRFDLIAAAESAGS